jgi:hypothetical protein
MPETLADLPHARKKLAVCIRRQALVGMPIQEM